MRIVPNSPNGRRNCSLKLREQPELADVASDQQTGGLQVSVNVDRAQASRYNVLPQAVDDTLYDAFGQRQVTTIFTQLNQYRVILEVDPRFQRSPESLDKIYVKSTTGLMVPLSAFATVKITTAPLTIAHEGQFPAVTLSFNLALAHRSARRWTRSTAHDKRSACRKR